MATSSQTQAERRTLITRMSDALIIRAREQDGRVFSWGLEQKPRTLADIQAVIDGTLSEGDEILGVWRVETNEYGFPATIDDISDLFDIRTVAEIEAEAYEARERAFEDPSFRQPYSTLNHAQQGI